jgi:hypothetical protein
MKLDPAVQRCHGKHCPNREGCARYEDRERGNHAFENMCGHALQHRITWSDVARMDGVEIELLKLLPEPRNPGRYIKDKPNFPPEMRERAIALKAERPAIAAENIAAILGIEFGQEPSINTIYRWLDIARRKAR